MQLSPSFIAATKKGEIEVKKKLMSGILVTMFLVTMITIALPARVSAQFVGDIKIGVVGPKGWIQWVGLWEGAQMARDLINDAGGMVGPDGRYRVVLVDIDEHSVPILDPAAAIAELLAKLEANPDMQFLIGGSSSEYVLPMREVVMDYAAEHKRPIWFIAAQADELIDCGVGICGACVRCDYARYKYMFRAISIYNQSITAKVLLFGLIAQIVAPKLSVLFVESPLKTYIIAENLHWCDDKVYLIQTYGPILTYLGFPVDLNIVGVARPSPYQTNFTAEFDDAEAAGAKLVIHIFSTVAGFYFIRQWGLEERKFACVGINVESMVQEFWEVTGGLCEYETILAYLVGTGINIHPNAKPLSTAAFCEEYETRYGHAPIYPAWAAYDTIIMLNETSYDPTLGKGWMKYWQAGDIDMLIRHIESLGAIDGFHGGNPYRGGVLCRFMFTGVGANASWPLCGIYHDKYCAADCMAPVWPSGLSRPLVVQWQKGGGAPGPRCGRMEVVWPQDQPYSRKWMIPPWMLPAGYESLAETDFAGGPQIPTAIPGYYYPSPDRTVDGTDLVAVIAFWFKTPPFFSLEADMQNPYEPYCESSMDHFIDIWDLARVAIDLGKSY